MGEGRPQNTGQFTETRMTPEEHAKTRAYYFGECGPHQVFYPKRHRWEPWQYGTLSVGTKFRERICRQCSLVDYRTTYDTGGHNAD